MGKKLKRKRLKAFFLRHGCAGAAFGFERAVYVLKGGKRFAFVNRFIKLLGHLVLLGYRFFDCFPSFGKGTKIFKSLLQSAQSRIIHRPVQFFAVTGDKRDCVALVKQGNDIIDVALLAIELAGEYLTDCFQRVISFFTYKLTHAARFMRFGAHNYFAVKIFCI